jgi:hypothetical protein
VQGEVLGFDEHLSELRFRFHRLLRHGSHQPGAAGDGEILGAVDVEVGRDEPVEVGAFLRELEVAFRAGEDEVIDGHGPGVAALGDDAAGFLHVRRDVREDFLWGAEAVDRSALRVESGHGVLGLFPCAATQPDIVRRRA